MNALTASGSLMVRSHPSKMLSVIPNFFFQDAKYFSGDPHYLSRNFRTDTEEDKLRLLATVIFDINTAKQATLMLMIASFVSAFAEMIITIFRLPIGPVFAVLGIGSACLCTAMGLRLRIIEARLQRNLFISDQN